MKSIFECILTKRYGLPEIIGSESSIEYWWKRNDESFRSILYAGLDWSAVENYARNKYQCVYGGFYGGFLIGDSLKIATLANKEIYGLYTLEELQGQLEIGGIHKKDPEIIYFMDAANVWFYGFRDNHLFVYDIETDELDDLGEIESALDTVIDGWDNARNQK
jgi:hypothetical protein